jgi:hypothetical protein
MKQTEIMKNILQDEFDSVVWVKNPDQKEFRSDIDRIVYEMTSGENTCL